MNTLFCNTTFFSAVLFLHQLNCGLLLKGVIFLGLCAALPAPASETVIQQGCRVSFLVAILIGTFFFSPVSFQLDQLTDPATSDAVGSLGLT